MNGVCTCTNDIILTAERGVIEAMPVGVYSSEKAGVWCNHWMSYVGGNMEWRPRVGANIATKSRKCCLRFFGIMEYNESLDLQEEYSKSVKNASDVALAGGIKVATHLGPGLWVICSLISQP